MSMQQAIASFEVLQSGRELVEQHSRRLHRGQMTAFEYLGFSEGCHRFNVMKGAKANGG